MTSWPPAIGRLWKRSESEADFAVVLSGTAPDLLFDSLMLVTAGNLLGTTRTAQSSCEAFSWGNNALVCSSLSEIGKSFSDCPIQTAGGVVVSFPGQNGHSTSLRMRSRDSTNSSGRSDRWGANSVQLPVTGSNRDSPA